MAVGDSALSQIDNPATLSLQEAWRFDVSSQLSMPELNWSGPIDTSSSEIKLIPLLDFGLAIPVNDRLTFGLAGHTNIGLSSRYKIRHLLLPFSRRQVGSELVNFSVLANVGYKLTDKLSVGGGLRTEMAVASFDVILAQTELKFTRGQSFGVGFQLGLHYQAREDLAFGLAYRSTTWFDDMDVGNVKALLWGGIPIRLGKGTLDGFRLPQRFSAGVAWDATDRLKLVGEIRRIDYSNSLFNLVTLKTDGLLNFDLPFPIGYRDQWVFIVGADLELNDRWTLGLGYNYGTKAVPSSNLLPMASIIGAEHHITVGLRYEKDNFWIGGGYILGLKTSLRGRGISVIPLGIDYGLSNLEQTQHSLFLGFGYTW